MAQKAGTVPKQAKAPLERAKRGFAQAFESVLAFLLRGTDLN
jgi:hypothetical protein